MAQIPQMRYLYLTSAFLRKKEETPLLYSFVNKYFELLVLLTHAVLKPVRLLPLSSCREYLQ